MRTCTKCLISKENSEFYVHKQRKDGFFAYCKVCCQQMGEKYRTNNPLRVQKSRMASRFKKRYNGLDVKVYEALFNTQQGKCAICSCAPKEMLHLDHDHTTSQVRGLLCRNCNLVLGFARDNPTVLSRAILYLNKSPEKTHNSQKVE